jgi:hypothetical protein
LILPASVDAGQLFPPPLSPVSLSIDPGQFLRLPDWLTWFHRSKAGARRPVMFFDNVVFAGVLTVGLMVLFFAGFGFFIWKDANKRKKP